MCYRRPTSAWILRVVAIICYALFAVPRVAGDTVKRPGMEFSRLELFLDDELISNTRNIRREIVQPTKHPGNPIIRREHPWETGHACLYGSVLYDQQRGIFRMWYNAFGKEYRDQQYLAYAESNDGFHWKKPLLDINSLPGHERTNIVMGLQCNIHGPCVIRNPDQSDARRRFLLLFDSYPHWRKNAAALGIQDRSCYAAESSDGLHWSPPTGRLAFEGKADSGQSIVWEPREQTFRSYTRLSTRDAFGQRIRIWKLNESPDFVDWSEPMELMRTDERDGYPDVQIQQLTVTRYDGIYIGLLSLFRISQYVEADGGVDEGPQVNDIQLVTSRDGIHFTRVAERAMFLPHAGYGEFGTFGFRTSQLVKHDDKVFIYCDGRTVDAGSANASHLGGRLPGMEIGLFTLPRDRFVAMTPRRVREEALVELLPMQYPDGQLTLNASVVKSGAIEAEIATLDGASVVEGFARSDSVKITGDSLDHEILWQRDGNIYSLNALPDELKDKPIRLRLWIRQGKVFALRSN